MRFFSRLMVLIFSLTSFIPSLCEALETIAYAHIDMNGKVINGSQGIQCEWDKNHERYRITIPGVNYHFASYLTFVTPVDPHIVSASSVEGKLLIELMNIKGEKVKSMFQFITFKK